MKLDLFEPYAISRQLAVLINRRCFPQTLDGKLQVNGLSPGNTESAAVNVIRAVSNLR